MNAETIETTANQAEQSNYSGLSFSRLLWAAFLVLAANLAVLGSFSVTPELKVGLYGAEGGTVRAYDKPSPFAEVADADAKPRRVKQPPKLTPMVYQDPGELELPRYSTLAMPRTVELPMARSSELAIPRSTPATSAASVRPADDYSQSRRVAPSALDLPGSTAQR